MMLALKVFEVTAPVFFLAAIGFIWVKKGYEYPLQFVTRLAMTISVPCLIFVTLMQADIDLAALGSLTLASLLSYGLVALVFFVVVRVKGLSQRTYLAPLIFGNTGNLGLPLAFFAFGDMGLSIAVVIFAVMAFLSFTVGIWMVSGSSNPMKVLKEPSVAGSFFGAIFLWQGWETPVVVTNTLSLLGQLAIPLMLVTLGVALARLKPSDFGSALWLSLLKAAVCVALALGVGLWFELEPMTLGLLIMQVATPVAVTSYLIAEKYGAESTPVAGLVVVSTVLSVITLPLILAFFL